MYLKRLQLSVISTFCNSQYTISKLKLIDCKTGQVMKTQIYQKIEQFIQDGHEILVCWVPSHYKIEKNKRVDKAIREAAEGEKI